MRHRLLLPFGSALALSACVAGPPPEISTPIPQLPQNFAYAPDAVTGASVGALLPEGDPAFETLAAAALEGSPTLAEALARVDAAQARAARAGAQRLPTIGAGGNVTATRTNPAQFGGALPPGIDIDTEQVSYGANLNASWNPDIFGRLRLRDRAATLRVDAAGSQAAAIRLALVAEIAASVIDWRTLDERAAALQQDLDAASELVRLAGVREEAGIAPGFDRVRAQSAAAASRRRLESLRSERARLVGRLVTLTATPAQNVTAALAQGAGYEQTGALPPAPAAAPAVLLSNRPDVLAAAANLAANDAELYAAAASRFPDFSLSGTLGLLAFSPADLFDTDSIVGSLVAAVAAPLVDFGRVEAEIDLAAADKRAAFQAYRGAVYTGLGEAEAGYGVIAAADRELAAANAERDTAERAARLADTRFRAGLSNFLEVLEARRAADASGERAAAALGQARRARVVLWQVLGGGGAYGDGADMQDEMD
ncbi:putative efflux pump outer membrane protein SepC [Alteripontixanthobacter maritimus]|uniref:Putative efflux pump outer membrane protein SepC n=1 Tax=Alteripontixanthobacter maritimus TaxID=2161824 RepID=A0A369Q3N4_9SPHN|nr:efflux transporter outer membrane subunit [Alteripontixanthobacter maritimus]RDC59122.1 putative efflux pump outer membrane protein SepC [Alteripontixanthobacter maritimus]